ncbi:hypothetical protein L7F22_048450 [Adiantum nelumboides]|nr:hypothetical protein [Adiantum nelumboides]
MEKVKVERLTETGLVSGNAIENTDNGEDVYIELSVLEGENGLLRYPTLLIQQLSMVELLVRMDWQGYERTIRKALSKLKGVENVEVDFELHKVTIIGFVDPMKVLKHIRKSKKAAKFRNPNRQENYLLDYVYTPYACQRTYNYHTHGFNSSGTSHYYESSTYHHEYLSDKDEGPTTTSYNTSTMFSEDNPDA